MRWPVAAPKRRSRAADDEFYAAMSDADLEVVMSIFKVCGHFSRKRHETVLPAWASDLLDSISARTTARMHGAAALESRAANVELPADQSDSAAWLTERWMEADTEAQRSSLQTLAKALHVMLPMRRFAAPGESASAVSKPRIQAPIAGFERIAAHATAQEGRERALESIEPALVDAYTIDPPSGQTVDAPSNDYNVRAMTLAQLHGRARLHIPAAEREAIELELRRREIESATAPQLTSDQVRELQRSGRQCLYDHDLGRWRH